MVKNIRDHFPIFFLPALTGILGFCSYPDVNFGLLAWISYVPLAVFLYHSRNLAQAFWGGLLAGFIQQIWLLKWIPSVLIRYGGLPKPSAWVAYVLLVAMLALFPALTCALMRLLMRRLGSAFLLALPVVWVAQEYSLSYVPFGGFPWLLSGYSQTANLHLIQIADLTGVYGVSFFVLWVNISLAWLFLHKRPGWFRSLPSALAIALLGGCLLYGTSAIRRWGSLKADRSVAMIQANLSSEEDWQSLRWKYREGYQRMADRLPPGGVELLILPEAPSPVNFQDDEPYRRSMQSLARRFALGLIFNNIAYGDGAGERRYFNCAYFLDAAGRVLERYDKLHLVPFGEYIPLRTFFSFIETISKDIGDFQPGSEYRTAVLQGQRINAVICFEAVFPQIARRFVEQGSRLMVNLTNDEWYGRSAAPYQHLLMSRWRALENRRFLLRSTNSGISAVVDPLGRIQASTGLLTEDICQGRFAFIEGQSFYSLHGDWFARLCAIITAGLALCCLISWIRDRRMQSV